MNKEELLKKINNLLIEADMEKETAKAHNDKMEQMFNLGKINGLLWAKIYIQELKETK